MLAEDILTMSFAPRDSHKSQIQFALERGIPAFVAMLGTRRLPFPAFSFDLVHCSRCLIPFTAYSEFFVIVGLSSIITLLLLVFIIKILALQMLLTSLKWIGCFDQEDIWSSLVPLYYGMVKKRNMQLCKAWLDHCVMNSLF
jgi:hypothetical protein